MLKIRGNCPCILFRAKRKDKNSQALTNLHHKKGLRRGRRLCDTLVQISNRILEGLAHKVLSNQNLKWLIKKEFVITQIMYDNGTSIGVE